MWHGLADRRGGGDAQAELRRFQPGEQGRGLLPLNPRRREERGEGGAAIRGDGEEGGTY